MNLFCLLVKLETNSCDLFYMTASYIYQIADNDLLLMVKRNISLFCNTLALNETQILV